MSRFAAQQTHVIIWYAACQARTVKMIIISVQCTPATACLGSQRATHICSPRACSLVRSLAKLMCNDAVNKTTSDVMRGSAFCVHCVYTSGLACVVPRPNFTLHRVHAEPISFALQFNVEDSEKVRVKWYKNHKFWTTVACVLVTEALLISAIVMVVFYKHHKVIWFEWWRWLFFFSGASPFTLQ